MAMRAATARLQRPSRSFSDALTLMHAQPHSSAAFPVPSPTLTARDEATPCLSPARPRVACSTHGLMSHRILAGPQASFSQPQGRERQPGRHGDAAQGAHPSRSLLLSQIQANVPVRDHASLPHQERLRPVALAQPLLLQPLCGAGVSSVSPPTARLSHAYLTLGRRSHGSLPLRDPARDRCPHQPPHARDPAPTPSHDHEPHPLHQPQPLHDPALPI